METQIKVQRKKKKQCLTTVLALIGRARCDRVVPCVHLLCALFWAVEVVTRLITVSAAWSQSSSSL